jgi:hypothetical protein
VVIGQALDSNLRSSTENKDRGLANWWLYTSPVGDSGEQSEGIAPVTKLKEEDEGDRWYGPTGPSPVGDILPHQKGRSHSGHLETLVPGSESSEAAAAIPSVLPKTYKEVLLTPAREVFEPRERKRKKTRWKMSNCGFPRVVEDRNRRDDRVGREERNWDTRRSGGIG